ncbi:MAG: aminoacyl-histidine dipeptidase [Thioploca sp.]|nr:aminoacyl-histidine dipeptidase [Thioploca sp.]
MVVLQAHMDMVCEKADDSSHDFNYDAIQCLRDGDWLHADKTTLGADNGIGLAIALALASDTTVVHPPLELLFTVDEEAGLIGASGISPDLLTGSLLINLDSEEEGVLINGCAGGSNSYLSIPLQREPLAENQVLLQIEVSGLQGGHSGIDINKHLANANQLLARTLQALHLVESWQLIEIQGGTVHNAIARHAQAWLTCPPTAVAAIQTIVATFNSVIKKEFAATEPDILISVLPLSARNNSIAALSAKQSYHLIQLLLALPHGVITTFSTQDTVETSCNLAVITTQTTQLDILISQRSSVGSRLEELTNRINAIAALAGAQVKTDNLYPAWQPNLNSPLLAHCQTVYYSLFGQEPAVQVIHAGLETGIIGHRYPQMDMISFGPTIYNPHSPDERLFIPSVEKVWDFLVALLNRLGTIVA